MGTLFSFFLIPLLSGFIILYSFEYTRDKFILKNGFVLILSCLLCGLFSYYIIALAFSLKPAVEFKESNYYLKEFVRLINDTSLNSATEETITVLDEKNNIIQKTIKKTHYPPKPVVELYLLFIGSILTFLLTLSFGFMHWLSLELSKKYPNSPIINLVKKINGKIRNLSIRKFFINNKFHAYSQKDIKKFRDIGPLEAVIADSVENDIQVIVTLKSRKVYIGLVKRMPSSKSLPEERSLAILPISSGYRHVKKLNMEILNDYFNYFLSLRVYRKIPKADRNRLSDEDELQFDIGTDKEALNNPLCIKVEDIKFLNSHMAVTVFMREIETAAIWTGNITTSHNTEINR